MTLCWKSSTSSDVVSGNLETSNILEKELESTVHKLQEKEIELEELLLEKEEQLFKMK